MNRGSIVDVLAQQAGWWSTVLLVQAGHGAWAWCGTGAVVVGHTLLAADKLRRLGVALFSVALGLVADSALITLGIIAFPEATSFPPVWMLGLWAAFGVGFCVSLRWVRGLRWYGQLATGVIAGPVAYRAGAAFDAIQIREDVVGYLVLGAVWGLATLALAHGIDRIATDQRAADFVDQDRTSSSAHAGD
ncbi:MAG: DUF2878 domain-containing protein [Deltaproteobacteria bacterium]